MCLEVLSLQYLLTKTKKTENKMSRYRFFNTKRVNNRKETRGRAVRKQYVPLYTTNEKEREKLVSQWREEGVSSYEIERRLRQKRLILHEAV